MPVRDEENLTYQCDLESLLSEEGRRFLDQKYGYRLEVLKRIFEGRLGEIRALDVGIGYGMFLRALERIGIEDLHGMDPFERSIEIARGQTGARLVRGDINDPQWPVEKGSFDVITCMDVVEHLEDPGIFFRRARDYLREGGIVIVTTPNKELPYMMRSIPLIGFSDTNPTHINVRPPSWWKRLAVENGYDILETWKGEYLTHIRLIPKLLTLLCRLLRLDHRRIPVVNSFEQSFGMVLRSGKGPECG